MYITQYIARNKKLKRIGISYEEYLKSPTWFLIKTLAARQRKFQKCHVCESERRLQLHHMTYSKIHQLGRIEAQLKHLVALCDTCHGIVHSISKEKRTGLKHAVKIWARQFAGYRNSPLSVT